MPGQALNVFECPLQGTRLIEASAGTGKTWNICGLFLRLLLERAFEVQQILVVTFTNAATAELRERIRTRIAETLARLRGSGPAAADPFVDTLLASLRGRHGLSDDTMAQRLDLALQTFDEASIFTIHGFCQRALADTPFAAGLPMALELLTDDSELRMEVVHDFWRRHVAGDALPPALAEHLLTRKDSPEAWAALLQRQLAKPLSRVIWPAALDDAPDLAAALDTAALARAHASARATWQAQRAEIVACVEEALPRLNGNVYKPASVQQAAADWDRQLASSNPLAAPAGLAKLGLFTPERLKPKKGQPGPREHAFFAQAGALLQQLEATRQGLALARQRLLRQLLREGPARLRALKRERRVVAFDDMLFNLHAGLAEGGQPGLAAALQARFPAALIDEFQDTDPLQFAIFQAIYGPPGERGPAPLFLVGDPKQAIYSFRNADLNTYLQARHAAVAEYTLAENQRSTPALLDGLNGLFSINPRAFVLDGLGYQRVNCGSKPRKTWQDISAPRAPLQLWTLPADVDGQPLRKPAARQAAAVACAGEIARLLGAGQRREVLHGGQPLAGGDIAVLVRSHAQGAAMRQALAALGVGSVELSQASIFHSPDAEDLERVLAAVLSPARERLLRAALASVMLGFDAAAIEALSADEAGVLAFVTRFTAYREQWLQRGVGVMLRSLMAREGVTPRLLARADGERRLTNLLHLAELLHQAAEQHGAPEQLLRWLQAQRSGSGSDDAAQLRLESDRNLVQIITIHKSKGLEFPVVFCPFLWDGHAGGAPQSLEGREYHDDAGLPVLDFRDDEELGAAGVQAIKAQVTLERAAENLRLVYVALTRAVQRCTLVVGCYGRRQGQAMVVTESTRSRLNSLVAGAGLTPEAWQQNRLTPAEIAAAWQQFSTAHPGSVGLAPLPPGPWPRLDPRPVAADSLAALPPPAAIPGAWWIGSYSSLSQGVRHEAAAVDHDAHVPDDPLAGEAARAAAPLEDDDILHFPRGPEAGNCMHAVFERVDFTDPGTWPAAIATALREQPQGQLAPALATKLPQMLQRMLADVLATPLLPGLVLGEVGPGRRLVELEFTLPASRLGATALAAVLRAHGYPVPSLGFTVLEGHLRGFIDLVFEHGGRYYILDWKSNHLGHAPAAYGAAPLARAMAEHGYALQYLLYSAALHRYLARRLPGYRYDEHFGGALYLFVRGVRPGWTTADGRPTGVHFDRPPQALIEALSALFDAPQGAGAAA